MFFGLNKLLNATDEIRLIKMSAESHPIPKPQQNARRYTQMTAATLNKSKEDIEKTLNENFEQIKGGLERVFKNQSSMQKTNVKLANFINDRIQQELRVFQIDQGFKINLIYNF